jgi:hypothetical protein
VILRYKGRSTVLRITIEIEWTKRIRLIGPLAGSAYTRHIWGSGGDHTRKINSATRIAIVLFLFAFRFVRNRHGYLRSGSRLTQEMRLMRRSGEPIVLLMALAHVLRS